MKIFRELDPWEPGNLGLFGILELRGWKSIPLLEGGFALKFKKDPIKGHKY